MKKLSKTLSAALAVALLLCTAAVVPAKAAGDDIIIASLPELQSAISSASDGDIIYISEDIEITEATSIGSVLHTVSVAAVDGKYITISISEDFPDDQCVYFSNLVFMGGENSGISIIQHGGIVGLSNILDSELIRRKPMEGSHGQVVGTAVMDSKLLFEIRKRIERMAGIEPFLVLAMTALDLAVVPWRVRPDQLVADAQFCRSLFEQRRQITFTVRKSVGELEPIVRLNAFHFDATPCVPFGQFFQKIC